MRTIAVIALVAAGIFLLASFPREISLERRRNFRAVAAVALFVAGCFFLPSWMQLGIILILFSGYLAVTAPLPPATRGAKTRPAEPPPPFEQPTTLIPAPQGAGLAALINVKTTGLEPGSDEIIEFGAQLFAFDKSSGEIFGVVDEYFGLRQPSYSIHPKPGVLSTLTMKMLRGRSLDAAKIESILDRAEFLVAHNADFDRRFVSKLFAKAQEKLWICSMRQIDWFEEGCPDRKLPTLLRHFGLPAPDSHRARAHVTASIELLSQQGQDGRRLMCQLIQATHRMKPPRKRRTKAIEL